MDHLSTRQTAILNQIRQQGRVRVGDLARTFRTTPQTIRKDLRALSDAHLVLRFHGGATLIAGVEYANFEVRESIQVAQKDAIGRAAAARIPDNVTLLINAGTTTAAVVRALQRHVGLRIVTDNVAFANDLRVMTGVDAIVPGGSVRRSDGAILGSAAVDFIRQFYADFAIIGAAAMGENGDLFDYDLRQAHIARAIIGNARHVILAADGSKFDRAAPVRIGHLGQAHTFVTDSAGDHRMRDLCETHEVDLVEALPAASVRNARTAVS